MFVYYSDFEFVNFTVLEFGFCLLYDPPPPPSPSLSLPLPPPNATQCIYIYSPRYSRTSNLPPFKRCAAPPHPSSPTHPLVMYYTTPFPTPWLRINVVLFFVCIRVVFICMFLLLFLFSLLLKISIMFPPCIQHPDCTQFLPSAV